MAGRGQPIIALLTLLAGWTGGRAMGWQELPSTVPTAAAALATQALATNAQLARGPAFQIDTRLGPQSYAEAASGEGAAYGPTYGAGQGFMPAAQPMPIGLATCGACVPYARPVVMAQGWPGGGAGARARRGGAAMPLVIWDSSGYGWGPSATGLGGRPAPAGAGWQLDPALAGIGSGRGGGGGLPGFVADGAPPFAQGDAQLAAPAPRKAKRWSGDAWAFLRNGNVAALPPGLTAATYGGGQAGAVLRFRIDRDSRHRPTAYMRTTSTLGQLPESAAALGVSARPLAGVPVFVALEGRLTQQRGQNRIQPAAMAVTELPPFTLPLGLRGELYAQGGYVAGQYATPFADGQLRLDHGLFSLGPVDGRLGGGVWGGIQKGASRLDAGPGMTLAFPLRGRTYGRLALDWRQRVAGNASPDSGATLTLSAGF